MRWKGVSTQEISLNLKRSSGASSKFPYFKRSNAAGSLSGADWSLDPGPGRRASMVVLGSNRKALLNRSR